MVPLSRLPQVFQAAPARAYRAGERREPAGSQPAGSPQLVTTSRRPSRRSHTSDDDNRTGDGGNRSRPNPKNRSWSGRAC
ncbi:hypothetical protein Misp01_34120 [Microtetraspora sp. NBRC 13810]|nr:hypothetical protein Misp01_34120 [Microtetraspora sp. NBRC 13810]